jgi:hypothetical protein
MKKAHCDSSRQRFGLKAAATAGLTYLAFYSLCGRYFATNPLQDRKTFGDLETFSFDEMPFTRAYGDKFELLRPWYDMRAGVHQAPQLLAPPESWVEQLTLRLNYLDSKVAANTDRSVSTRARAAYLELMKLYVSGLAYGAEEMSVTGNVRVGPFQPDKRAKGLDWAYLGMTMTGGARLDNVRLLLEDVVYRNIPGDYIETGVWRGGSSIFARAVLRSLNEGGRMSYVCDSFKGLPPGDKKLHPRDRGWNLFPYLEESAEEVAKNFRESGVLDSNVVFAKGFFNETMPPLASRIKRLAVMRLDGDMYESTVDVLYHLYDKLGVGGYVIIDDWFGFPAKTACEDFFRVHNINPEINVIDETAAYWKKTKDVDIQYWRYEQTKFT